MLSNVLLYAAVLYDPFVNRQQQQLHMYLCDLQSHVPT
jgi:hypothetical protein